MVNTPPVFNFWVPVNNEKDPRHYDYQLTKGRTFKHITISHEASLWIGDRGIYQSMVNTSMDNPTKDNVKASSRGSAYTHENEVAKAHYYSVTFDEKTPASGSKLELAPTGHAAMMRFTFDDTAAYRNVVLNSTMGTASVEFSEDGKSFKAISNHDMGNNGASKIFIYGEFDVAGTSTITDDSSDNRVWTLVTNVRSMGERTFSISAKRDGYWQDFSKGIDLTIEGTDAFLYEALFQTGKVAVNQPVQVQVVTSLGVAKLGVRSENGRAISFTVDSCVDEGDQRIWAITLSIGTAGNRLFDFMAADESGKWLGHSLQDSIVVTK